MAASVNDRPKRSEEILYWLGAGLALHEAMEWFRSDSVGVFRQRNNARLSEAEIDHIHWLSGRPLTQWLERGVDPRAIAHERTLSAEMARYAFITARDWALNQRIKYPLDEAYDGRGVYFLIDVPKIRFSPKLNIQAMDTQVICTLQVILSAHQEKPRIRVGNWELHHRPSAKIAVQFPISPAPHDGVFDDTLTLFRLQSRHDPTTSHTVSASTTALRSGLLARAPWRVLYVGISNQMKGRWARHTKIAEAVALCPDDSEVALMALHFEESVLWQSEVLPSVKQIFQVQPREIRDRHRLAAIEAALIRHFQPPLNIDGREKPGWLRKNLHAALANAGLTKLKVSIASNDSPPFRFFSDNAKPADEVSLEYELEIKKAPDSPR